MVKAADISGGMTTSVRGLNGIWFNHEDLASLATEDPNEPFVIDHSMSVEGIAGMLIKVEARRVPIKVATREGKEVEESATILDFHARLSEDFPAFKTALGTIQAIRSLDKVPEVSIAVQASNISYEALTDRLFLNGLRLVHHSHVAKGAAGRDDEVGVTEVKLFCIECEEGGSA